VIGSAAKAEKSAEAVEIQADAIAIYLIIRSGYSPQAMPDFFDRLTESKGKTGGIWSDLFGETTQDSKRLREMLKTAKPMPAACVQPRSESAGQYAAWRNSVIEYIPARNKETLPGLISKRALTQCLIPTINSVHISPDGKYVLAQDESGIFVLTRQPLKPLFHIDAWDASLAKFTPDSLGIVYDIGGIGESPRVEKWDIASQKRIEVHKIYVAKECHTHGLSPDGRTLVCVNEEATPGLQFNAGPGLDLDLYDAATGTSYWHEKVWSNSPRLDPRTIIFSLPSSGTHCRSSAA